MSKPISEEESAGVLTLRKFLILGYSLLLVMFFGIFSNQVYAKDSASTHPLFIYISKNADDIKKFAAEELQKHLFLLTDTLPEIRYDSKVIDSDAISFFVGIKPPHKDIKALKPEEGRYVIENQKVYIYGDDIVNNRSHNKVRTVINKYNHTGTLFAVYDFLFNELGIHWIEPGDRGIIYKKKNLDQLDNHSYSWSPKYSFRGFRMTPWKWNYLTGKKIKMYENVSSVFQLSEKEVQRRYDEEGIWLRRMKMGMHNKPKYGHAFTKYWEKYGDTHPEWFALGRFGFRGVTLFNSIKPTRVKFCVSNKELQKEIVKNWRLSKNPSHYYNACINDSKGYCTCSKCKSLDAKTDAKSMTDRYVYFWNALLEGIKQYDKDAKLIVYAYSDYRHKPINRRISPDITIGLVPNYSDSIKDIEKNFLDWKVNGMKEHFLRPNDFTYDIGLPPGSEKYIFDRYRIFDSSDMLGLDYERNYDLSNWDINGMGQYILARRISGNRSFTELKNEYLEAYGNAKKEISAYYTYWRILFEKKQLKYMALGKKYKKKFMYKDLHNFYEEKNFTHAEKLLDSALLKVSDTLIIHRIRRMKLANEHARLIFNAIVNKKKKSSCALHDFRKIHQKELLLSLPILLHFENHYKATGIQKYCQ